mmetsp:Transcript_96633/g.155872  ORF Transcript_96633/g.155872 Transcript_96633/m.155872 type:complete len:251 (+) Transcript_96633:2382-3134(+)
MAGSVVEADSPFRPRSPAPSSLAPRLLLRAYSGLASDAGRLRLFPFSSFAVSSSFTAASPAARTLLVDSVLTLEDWSIFCTCAACFLGSAESVMLSGEHPKLPYEYVCLTYCMSNVCSELLRMTLSRELSLDSKLLSLISVRAFSALLSMRTLTFSMVPCVAFHMFSASRCSLRCSSRPSQRVSTLAAESKSSHKSARSRSSKNRSQVLLISQVALLLRTTSTFSSPIFFMYSASMSRSQLKIVKRVRTF